MSFNDKPMKHRAHAVYSNTFCSGMVFPDFGNVSSLTSRTTLVNFGSPNRAEGAKAAKLKDPGRRAGQGNTEETDSDALGRFTSLQKEKSRKR